VPDRVPFAWSFGPRPERLKAAYGDRKAFQWGIAVQCLLPHAEAESVGAECRRLLWRLAAGTPTIHGEEALSTTDRLLPQVLATTEGS
jgi:hypothetical protein